MPGPPANLKNLEEHGFPNLFYPLPLVPPSLPPFPPIVQANGAFRRRPGLWIILFGRGRKLGLGP